MSKRTLFVNEIFTSIQGESTWSGLPCVFVRLRGCPLRCHYCDTSYAFQEGDKMPVQDIIDEIKISNIKFVEITGGEPLIQPSVYALMILLLDDNYKVLIETSGERDIANCDERAIRIIDIKTPDSGAADSFLESNYEVLRPLDEVKFVITSHDDFEWAVDIVRKHSLLERVHAVHFSPVMEQCGNEYIQGCEELDPKELSKWILESALQVRMHLQIHKYIWPAYARKV